MDCARYHDGPLHRSGPPATAPGLGDVRSIAEDSSGQIWISAGKQLLMLIADGRPVPVPDWTPAAEIEVIYKDAAGHLWIGTDGAGLFQYSGGPFATTGPRMASAAIRSAPCISDRTGALWISTFGSGLTKYANDKFTTVATNAVSPAIAWSPSMKMRRARSGSPPAAASRA